MGDPCCGLLLPAVFFECIGYFVLWPILQKKPKLGLPSRFSIADFVALLCYVQFVMAFGYYYRDLIEGTGSVAVILGALGMAVAALWGVAVSALNQLEIHGILKRALFLMVLLPGSLFMMVGIPILLASIHITTDEQFWACTVGGLAVIIVFGITLRYFAAWLVKDAKNLTQPAETIVGGYYLPADPRLRPSIMVVDYDPAWPQVFESLRSRVSEAVGDVAISIEHVGSTAVPGLAAKPIIDMGIIVPSQLEVAMTISRLAGIGYVHRGDLGIAGREAFRSPDDLPPHHLYLYIQGNLALANHLAIRDYLRREPAAVAAYGKLKKYLARRFPGDIDSYIDGKSHFLLDILRQAGFPAEQLAAIESANRKK